MKRRSILTVILYAGSVVVVGIAGIALGSAWGTRVGASKSANVQAGMQEYLETNVKGLEIGAPFPEINLWPADGSPAVTTTELLTKGGLIVFVSTGCKTCIDAATALNFAIKSQVNAPLAMLICRGESDQLRTEMAEHGIDLPLYRDVEDAFIRQYHVLTQPTAFLIGPNGVLSDIRAVSANKSDFTEMLNQ